jgi:pilus assembly protein CpaE
LRHEGNPHAAATVIAVACDEDTMNALRELLAADAVLPNNSVDFGEGLDLTMRSLPDVVIVGMEKDPAQAVIFAREAKKDHPRVTLVALAAHRDAQRILAATRAGFADYIVLPDDREQLRVTVQRAAYRPEAASGKGMVVAVLGAKGGVGCTFLATHLAAELAAIHRVICIDLDFDMGDVGPMMDIAPKDTIAELLPRIAQADERMISGSVVVHPSKVHFLCQPDPLDRRPTPSTDDMYNLLNAAAQGYQYVILDLGDNIGEAGAVGVNAADHVLLVTTPDVVAVRDAHRLMRSLGTLGVDRKRINIVINRMPARPFLTRDTIESNLAAKVVGVLPDSPQLVETAINEGKLVRDIKAKSDIVIEIARLVGVLSDDPDDLRSAADDERKAGIGRLLGMFGRTKK